MKHFIWLTAAALALSASPIASASDGYVTGNVSLRAGPDAGYPLITTIRAGTDVSIQGCTNGWEWCDVIAYGNRGWIAGDYIQYDYQNQRVYLPDYGARIGIPIISFVISSYWNDNYRNRSFYRQRTSWYSRPMPHHAPPPRPTSRPSSRPVQSSPPPRVVPMPRPIHDQQPRPTDNRPAPPRPVVNRPQPPRPIVNPRPTPRPEQAPRPNPMNQGNGPQPRVENPRVDNRNTPTNRPAPNPKQDRPNPKQDKPEDKKPDDQK